MNTTNDETRRQGGVTPGALNGAEPALPRVDSATLFAGAQELLIQHQAQTYRLRITAQGKLILTK
ncbi:MAG: hemin uptake protein HemP [Roseateles depolymerans]|uniref:Hemin uptake protein HemP n=1 Tax=Roseateles depolymerans TaxID=76731 RepID=A0A2W5FKG3_9BURK|nr:MAG: hemin uptake protein HemP [Roseateles depolymerans]